MSSLFQAQTDIEIETTWVCEKLEKKLDPFGTVKVVEVDNVGMIIVVPVFYGAEERRPFTRERFLQDYRPAECTETNGDKNGQSQI